LKEAPGLIVAKRPGEVEKMRRAGALAAAVLRAVARKARPGVRTIELDALAEDMIRRHGGRPLFKGYRGFPGTLCVSVNEEVVHGIPGERVLKEGDIAGVDVGVRLDRWCGDVAATVPIGEVSEDAARLVETARRALAEAIAAVRPGARLSEVCGTIQRFVESHGYSVVRQFTGHGIGRAMHEEPQVPNFAAPTMQNPVLKPGVTLAIEPMVNAGVSEVAVLKNGWTVVTQDGKLSAHFEHTVAVTEDGAEVLTV